MTAPIPPRRHANFISWVLRVLVVGLLAVLPFIGMNPYWVRTGILIAISALLASGLSLLMGYTGEMNLGQAAIYAAGAYTAGYVAKNVLNDILLCLVIAVIVSVLVGVIAGAPGLRVGGWVLAILTFFLVILIQPVVNLVGAPIGGFSGMVGVPEPALFGAKLGPNGFYVFVIIVSALWFLVTYNLIHSRHGRAMLVVKESPVLGPTLGISAYALKLKVYAIAAIPAGIAGTFFASLDGYIAPESFGLFLAVIILAASVIGGVMSTYGAIIGGAFVVLLPAQFDAFEEYSTIAFGVLLVVVGIFFSGGVSGAVSSLARRFRRSSVIENVEVTPDDLPELPAVAGLGVKINNVNKHFGGVKVLSDVSATVESGSITALIGSNGSGKTTLLNLICGLYQADPGSEILIGSTGVAGLKVHEISRLGVGRTFQTPIIPAGLTVREVVAAANFDRHRSSIIASILKLPSDRRARMSDAAVDELLAAMGLRKVADQPASALALGTRRMVELARAASGGNRLILLDEVAAGLDENEIEELRTMLQALKKSGATILIVEHNFSFVRDTADHVIVLSQGVVIADGSPEHIARHPEVLRSYLGEGVAVTGTRAHAAQKGSD